MKEDIVKVKTFWPVNCFSLNMDLFVFRRMLFSLFAFFVVVNTCAFATENIRHFASIVVEFSEKTEKISLLKQKELEHFIKGIHENSRVYAVEIAVWSDKDLPKNGDLGPQDIELAKLRGEFLKKKIGIFLRHNRSVKVFNMAEQPKWYSKLFHTKKDLLVDLVNKNIVSLQKHEEDLKIFQEKGGPSKAIILVRSESIFH